MSELKGTISVNTENIFPIIKKFLYSDHEIFLRELVSNAVDATQKLKKLSSLGEFTSEMGETKIEVILDKENKKITVRDRGIGMNAEEIQKYINQIAFSGATDFLDKYKDAQDAQIIGHFGMGFYSAFMVADKVEIFTRSYRPEDEAAHWVCTGTTDFVISKTVKKERGTDIVLHLSEESAEFADTFRLRQILNKYCKFLPVEVEFDGSKINNTQPIWTRSPKDLTDKDYTDFYHELYPGVEEPLFWIHLNVDYPFNLTGILYFPKHKNDIYAQRHKIQLYSRQVFITDEVKEVVPEFLSLMHGVIDSPDIPLNVSRSYLQADSNVKKINTYITKKVADKLQELFNNDRESYEAKWSSIGVFVKYGMITDEKFYEKAEKFALLENTESKKYTLEEYRNLVIVNQKAKNDYLVYLYTTDPEKQNSFIATAKRRGYDVLVFDHIIDTHFVGALERKLEKTELKRVDADVVDKLIEKEEPKAETTLSQAEQDSLKALIDSIVNDSKSTVELKALSTEEPPIIITQPEFMRRMKEMAQANGMLGDNQFMPNMYSITVNTLHPAILKIAQNPDAETQRMIASQAYDLALLAQGWLTGQKLTDFIERSISNL
jgi:molecular chaperone HtpG